MQLEDSIATEAGGNLDEVARLEQRLTKLQMEGVTPNTAPSYLPRIYRVDKIMENPEKFLSIIEKYARTQLRMGQKEAKKFANEVLDTVTHQRPYLDLEGATDSLDWVKRASGVHARTLEIEDELIEEFLESDIEILMRHHVKTMGMDIEIARRYGDVNMQSVLDDIVSEYNFLMGKVSSGIDKIVTGQPISVRMHRGSGGGGKVAFTNNALGDGFYFATNAKTASNFGKKVEQVDLNLRKPLRISSDEELLNILRSDGVSVDDLLKAKKEYDDFMLFMSDLKTKPKGKAGTDDWFKGLIKTTILLWTLR